MYQIRAGNFNAIELADQSSKARVNIFPDHGACLNELVFDNNGEALSVLWHSDDQASFQHRQADFFSGALLSPWPNRIWQGKYSFANRSYQLPLNDPGGPTAIHGLLYNRKFEFVSQDRMNGIMSWKNTYDGNDPGYPFPLNTLLTFHLNRQELIYSAEVENMHSAPVPFGLGWHPYISLNEEINDWQLQMPSETYVEVDKNLIPTSRFSTINTFQSLAKIGEKELNHGFLIGKNNQIAETLIYSPGQDIKLTLWQKTGESGLNYVQYYTPPGRMALAVEPMSCAPDVFNNQMGLIILEPGQKVSFQWGIRLET